MGAKFRGRCAARCSSGAKSFERGCGNGPRKNFANYWFAVNCGVPERATWRPSATAMLRRFAGLPKGSYLVFGISCLVFGVWYLVFGVWCLVPAFVGEIRLIFEPWQPAEYLETARQGEPFDPDAYDEEEVETERQLEFRQSGADWLLVERAKRWLLAE